MEPSKRFRMRDRDGDGENSDRARLEPELRRRFESLIASAPSDASVRFLLRRTKMGYQGLVKICSLHRNFVVRAAGSRISDTAENVFSQLTAQIERWRRERFAD